MEFRGRSAPATTYKLVHLRAHRPEAIPRGAPKKVTTVTVALAAAPSVWPTSSSVLKF